MSGILSALQKIAGVETDRQVVNINKIEDMRHVCNDNYDTKLTNFNHMTLGLSCFYDYFGARVNTMQICC